MTAAVSKEQRFSRTSRCPICDGCDTDPRGQSKRCSGFVSDDGAYTHCAREELAGSIAANGAGLFAHRMHGPCRCGRTHGAAVTQFTPRARIVETYDYANAAGELAFQVVRFEPKTFRQRKPDGIGGWEWSTKGVERVLFHLPQILAADREREVYVVEGERDVLTLERVGLLATTNPGGALKWKDVVASAREALRDRDVVVVADRDEIGEKHARDVAARLQRVVRSVRLVVPVAPFKDITDVIEAGGSVNELVPLERAANDIHRPHANTEREAATAVEGLLSKLIVDERAGKLSIRPTSANVATVLARHADWAGVIALDTFSGRIVTTKAPPWHELDAPAEVKPGAWTDADTARAVHWFARSSIADTKPLSVSTKIIDTAVLVVGEGHTVHPVREYLRSLRWDGTPRLDALAARYFGTEDTPYTRAVGACFMKGAVARVMTPGCKVDMCPVLEGPQGKLKSTAISVLASPWFTDSKIILGDKDAYQTLRGVWIVELGELAALSKSDVETTKAFISSCVDRYRPSYGRHEVEVPRQTVFIGTTNATSYLQDATGARRFPPLRIGTIDIDALRRDRDQLWAEALHRFKAGETWWLAGDLVADAAEEAEHRFVRHPWEEPIAAYLQNPQRVSAGVTTEELLAACGVDTAHRTTAHAMTVGSVLGRLGWERRRARVAGARVYLYFPKVES